MPSFRVAPFLVLIPALAAFAPLTLAPSSADACGGTFCDAGPTSMPVDQTGENILFHIGPDTVEAHIQIQIDPDTPAEAFAWVIPVTALPEFEVGSQPLFDAMLQGSVPRYGRDFTTDQCAPFDNANNSTGASTFGGAGETGGEAEGGDEPGDPEVVFQGSVGAFEIAVLDGGTVEGVMQWLGDNGYQQDPAAEPILADYLANDFLFVALKLGVEAGVDDVHPIVIRYSGVEPCVPIRLTRIAAAEDMDIRVFFLGDARVVPTNFRHVLVNPLKIDWINDGANYKEVISMAVDADGADGNAFVTEYAGSSEVINIGNIVQPGWDPAPYAALVDSPIGAIEELGSDGLFFCDLEWDNACTATHPLVMPLLSEYIPVPVGVDAALFYDCLSCYVDQIDLTAWNAAEFAAKLDERVFKPGANAAKLVGENPYLTRMYTTISPSEMNEDPIFRSNEALPDVEARRQATQRTMCDGDRLITLPDGREVFFPAEDDFVWPEFQDEMPWEEAIDQENMAENSPLVNLVDKSEEINRLLEDYNRQRGYGDIPTGCGGCSMESSGGLGGLAFGLASLAMFGFLRRRRDV